MSDAATAVDVEPKDRRTNAWKAWRARQPIQAEPSVTVTPGPTPPPADQVYLVPDGIPPVGAIEKCSAIPADIKIIRFDDFIVPTLTNDPAATLAFAQQPNAVASMADALCTAYSAYLCLVSPTFNRWWKENVMEKEKRHLLPKCGVGFDYYNIAVGK